MVLVNNPGDWSNLYSQLAHAPWHGWTFTDWIFPFFLFIGGVSMALSLGRLAEGGAPKAGLLAKLAKRAGLIFLIGFALNLIPAFDFGSVRIPGVLQRIALCTILAAPIVVFFSWRGQLAWIVGLLALYTFLQLVVGGGVLEPGKDFGAYIDRMLMDGHLWKQSKTWDPEGLVSTIPAVCSQLFGVLAGRWLLTGAGRAETTVWLLLGGLLMLWLGAILDTILMPINKSLWTPSFAVFMTGWALLLFGAFYWLLDGTTQPALREAAARWSKPFVIYGMNALFIFAFSGLVAKMLGWAKLTPVLYAPIKALPIGPVNTSLLYALLFNAAMFAVAWAMWRRKWFIKV
jgi:predicted acyltransferase